MATYNLWTDTIDTLAKGDIINIPYNGNFRTITLPKGVYKLECWGAQGGYRNNATYAGKGGYSYGTLTLQIPKLIYIYPGGNGSTSQTADGRKCGFNGGGLRTTYPGGGGASDIRIGEDSLYARVIVAGGGGSDGATTKQGMYGGGVTGGSASENYGSGGGGGTQTAGGAGGNGNAGVFGRGGEGLTRSGGYGGAGGGGWYGGGGSYPDGSGDDDRGGGGGSGYVYNSSTASNYPSGCLLSTDDYLTDSETIAGNASFTDYSGATVTGHSGDGACRITVINIESIHLQIKENGQWKKVAKVLTKQNAVWSELLVENFKDYFENDKNYEIIKK